MSTAIRIRKFRCARIEGSTAFIVFIDDPGAGEGQLLDMGSKLRVGEIYGMDRPGSPPIRIIDIFFNTDDSTDALARRLEAAGYRHLGVHELTGEAAWAIWNPVNKADPNRLEIKHNGRTLAVTVQLKAQHEDSALTHVVQGPAAGLTLSGNIRDLQDEVLAGNVRFTKREAP